MGRIVSLDIGKKRTGLAVTDPLGMIATGLTTVNTNELIPFLKNYAQTEQIDAFVVGEPRQMDYTESESMIYVRQVEALLTKHFAAIPIHRIDERFTSKMALQSMHAVGAKKKDRQQKALIDKISATILLQTYLAKNP